MSSSCRFYKSERLLKSSDYIFDRSSSSIHKGTGFKIIFRQNQLSVSRLGLAVSSKIGNAVKRNRIKRIVREEFRKSYINNQYDFLFIPYKTLDVSSLASNLKNTFVQIEEK